MPKRGSSLSEESPRKVTRRTSKSPAKSDPPQLSSTDDADLMNISDEEDVEVPCQEVQPEKKPPLAPRLISLDELRSLRERFFEKFMQDVINISDDSESIDPEMYRSLVSEIVEEDPAEQRYLVDQHMRDFVVEKMATRLEKWDRFLELSIQLARNQICSGSQPIALISDFMELSNLKQCEEIFEFVEQRLSVWKDPFFLNSGKNAVLRMCNDLLRRLSRAQNTIFCGRILLFLANYFPFSDRSGLNIVSEFNSDNITSYKSGDGSDDPEDKMEMVEDHDDKLFEGIEIVIPGLDKIVSITQEEKKKKVKVDYNLYVKFWSLQDFFRNPTQCYNKVSWKSFMLYIQDVLAAFTSFKIDGSQTQQYHKFKTPNPHPNANKDNNAASQHRSRSSINVVPKVGDDDLYFPKYLTNRRLLELQMGDPNFRRYFMVQLLIILQYLTTPVKFKSENQTLSEDQLDFVKKTTARIFTLLRDVRPCGKEFVTAVQHILKREDLWSKWKNDGCQSFKKPITSIPMESDSIKGDDNSLSDLGEKSEETLITSSPPKKRQLGDILEEAEKNNRFLLGNPELTRLWNICGDNLEACRLESRDFLPTIDTFFVEAFKELDPEPPSNVVADPSKREVKTKTILGNPNFGWRALRLLARNSPYFFQLAPSPPIQPLQNYLEFILKKIAAEMELPREEFEDNKLEDGSKVGTVSADNANDGPDVDQVVEGDADDNDELLKSDTNPERIEEEEEGEVDEKVRNLTEHEQTFVGRLIGDAWKKLALKFQFTNDEIEFFESEKGKDAGSWMLKMWTEQEKEDATAADLLYQLEGLKLRELVREVFP